MQARVPMDAHDKITVYSNKTKLIASIKLCNKLDLRNQAIYNVIVKYQESSKHNNMYL